MQFFGYFFSASAKKVIRFSRLMKVEMQFLLTFFCFGKKVRVELILFFLFVIATKRKKKV
jgi:hypothetical protein